MNLKTLFLVGLMLLLAEELHAQSYVGMHIGINSSKFSGDSPRKFQYVSKFQYQAGLDFNLKLKKDLFLSLSPTYINSGSKLQYPFENIEEETSEYRDSIDLKLRMFSLPLLLNIISGNDRWQFLGGFDIGIPIDLLADNSATETDLSEEINDVLVSMVFGLGYRIPIDKTYLAINLGYSQGLTNLANNLDDPDSYMPRIRFTSYRLSVSYLLPVGKSKTK
jgi:hypothetical protein